MVSKLKNILFSTRLTAVLFLVFATAMAFGTFIESKYSTSTARIWIYNTWWFEAIMGIFVLNFVGNISRYRLLRWKKWPVLVLHLSWILIIVGAFVTRYISYEGRMPIREGKAERVFYSDNTYLTAYIGSSTDSVRKTMQDDLIVTPEGLKSSLPWSSDFNGQSFSIAFVDFIKGAKRGMIPDEQGTELLKIVEAGDGSRHEHYLANGQVASIHGVLFSLNKPTDGAINISANDSVYTLNSPFEGNFMRMADRFQGAVSKDSVQPLQLRSLYSMAGMQFVIPEPLSKGREGVVAIPEDERTENDLDALVVEVSVGGEKVTKKLLGAAGTANFTDKFSVGGLDFNLGYGSKVYELPFAIQLNDFIAEKYPGTETGYASFMSKVTVHDERPFDYDIFMNNILDHRGYRFFQASFHPDEKGTVLSVNHDQWGTWITYVGYFLLYLGLMGILFFGKSRFKDLGEALKKTKAKKAKLAASLLLGALFGLNAQEQSAAAGHNHSAMPTQAQVDSVLQATMVPKEHAEKFGKLIIQDEGGRMKPINTFSSELLRKLSRKDRFNGMNSDQVFLSMIMNPAVWYNTEFIILDKFAKNDSIRHTIDIPEGQKYVKATDFFDEKGNYKLEPVLREATATNNPDAFEKDVEQAHIRVSLLNQALGGQILKIFPLLNDENNKWISDVEYRGGQYPVSDSLYANFIKNAIPYYLITLRKAKETGDYADAEKLLAAFHQNQKNHGSEVLPPPEKVNTEVIYNKLNIFNHLYKLYGVVGILLFLILIWRIFTESNTTAKDRSVEKDLSSKRLAVTLVPFSVHRPGFYPPRSMEGTHIWPKGNHHYLVHMAYGRFGIAMVHIGPCALERCL